jgi:hypothetical protein
VACCTGAFVAFGGAFDDSGGGVGFAFSAGLSAALPAMPASTVPMTSPTFTVAPTAAF